MTTKWRKLSYPPALVYAIASAFFGGRFEISQRGPVNVPCFSYDINSAYPYAYTFLPCLVHGTWEHTSSPSVRLIEDAHMAIVRYSLPYSESLGRVKDDAAQDVMWGPFPYRMGKGHELVEEGSIIFPVTSPGGWLYKDEILAGLAHFPNVKIHEAWVYRTSCSCKVFRHSMPSNYNLRLAWGKEGKGIVTKNGVNSCYGKNAQSKGKNPPYQCFPWAGQTTSSCRAQDLVLMAKAPESILMVATDGLVATKRLYPDKPRETMTGNVKPLGGWDEKGAKEEDGLSKGIFLIRPGIAFPIDDRGSVDTKARGIGKAILRDLRQQVQEKWKKDGATSFDVKRPMFWGSRSMIRRNERTGEFSRGGNYGRFEDQTVSVNYHPTPKRPCCDGNRILPWAIDSRGAQSEPYAPALGKKAKQPAHVRSLIEEKSLYEDQPDIPETQDQEKEF